MAAGVAAAGEETRPTRTPALGSWLEYDIECQVLVSRRRCILHRAFPISGLDSVPCTSKKALKRNAWCIRLLDDSTLSRLMDSSLQQQDMSYALQVASAVFWNEHAGLLPNSGFSGFFNTEKKTPRRPKKAFPWQHRPRGRRSQCMVHADAYQEGHRTSGRAQSHVHARAKLIQASQRRPVELPGRQRTLEISPSTSAARQASGRSSSSLS